MTNIRLCIASFAIIAAACHPLERSRELEVLKVNTDAKTHISAADFETARTEYEKALALDPENAEAAFGWAISDLMLVLDSKPMNDFLDLCNQPHFNVGREVFGPNGVLAKERLANAGTAELEIYHQQYDGAGLRRVEFAPNAVRAEYEAPTESNEFKASVSLSIRESGGNGTWVTLQFNPDDVVTGDAVATPIVDALTVDISRIDGSIRVWEPGLTDATTLFGSQVADSGEIRFVKFGRNPGDAVQIELSNVVLRGYCPESACDARYPVSGSIDDVITERVDLDPSTWPFANIGALEGPPAVNEFVQAVEHCDQIHAPFVAGKVQEIGDRLQVDSQHLDIVLNSPNAEIFSYALPRVLLHTKEDIPMNITDARTLKAMVDLSSALAELMAQYKYAQGALELMVETYDEWGEDDNGMPVERQVRDFKPSLVAMNLHVNLLVEEPDFDLTKVRERLDRGLEAASWAFRNKPGADGLLDFRALPMRQLSTELADAIDEIRKSIYSEGTLAIPNEITGVHLKKFFDQPLDRDRILELTGLASLVRLEPAGAMSSEELIFEYVYFLEDLDKHTGGVIDLPPDMSHLSCSPGVDCPTGYFCSDNDTCAPTEPWIVSESAWTPVFPEQADEWPVFLNPLARDIAE